MEGNHNVRTYRFGLLLRLGSRAVHFLPYPQNCPAYKTLSVSAKMLYALMLDRMDLSARNRWMDENGRVYIYYRMSEIMSTLGCGHNKAIALYAELEKVGLIERKKRGMGRPAKIYVKNFITKTGSQQTKKEVVRRIYYCLYYFCE